MHGKLPFSFGSQDSLYEGDLCKRSRHIYGQLPSEVVIHAPVLVTLAECMRSSSLRPLKLATMTDAKQGGEGRIRAVVAEWEMAEATKTVREIPTGIS